MAGHLLALEGLAGVLPLPGRTEAAMRDRDAVGRAQPVEIVPLHPAGEALADAGPGHVDILAGEKMRRSDLLADRDERIVGNAKLGELRLRLDLGLGEMPALRLRHVLDLGGTDPELQRGIAVLVLGALR